MRRQNLRESFARNENRVAKNVELAGGREMKKKNCFIGRPDRLRFKSDEIACGLVDKHFMRTEMIITCEFETPKMHYYLIAAQFRCKFGLDGLI